MKALRLDAKEVQRKPTVPRYLSALRAAMSTSPEVLCESLESKLLPRAWAAEPLGLGNSGLSMASAAEVGDLERSKGL